MTCLEKVGVADMMQVPVDDSMALTYLLPGSHAVKENLFPTLPLNNGLPVPGHLVVIGL